MRKNAKRSLLFWSLATSLSACSLCWVALSPDQSARDVAAQSERLWVGLGGPVFWDSDPDRKLIAKTSHAPAETRDITTQTDAARRESALREVAEIEAWSDVSLESVASEPAAIPAPDLNSISDLFGFSATSPEVAERTSGGSEAMLPPQRLADDPVDEEPFVLVPPERPEPVDATELLKPSDDLVLRINSDLLFDDAGQDAQGSDESLLATPGDIAFPSVFEAPAPIAADLVADAEKTLDDDGLQTPAELAESAEDSARVPAPAGSLSDDVPHLSGQSIVETFNAPLPATPDVAPAPRESSAVTRVPMKPRSATWPVCKRLVDQLDLVRQTARDTSSGAALMRWSDSVQEALNRLPEAHRLGDPMVGQTLQELELLRSFAAEHAELLNTASARIAWLQAAYAIERRLSVWTPIYDINSGSEPVSQYVTDDFLSVTDAIVRLRDQLAETGDAEGWNSFLLLDELEAAFHSGDDSLCRELAQKFLARLTWPKLQAVHRAWLGNEAIDALTGVIRPWASTAVDYASLLQQIERAESNAIDLVTAEIAQSMRALRYANHPKAKLLARNLDTYYRNANLRFAVSGQLLNRMMPDIPARDVPVRTTLLGSRVTGMSRISSDLQVRLVPDPASWQIQLETNGEVATRSVGRRGPAAFNTTSANRFDAETPIKIRRSDIRLGRSSVDVRGNTRLRGVDTEYDGWPLVETLVRSIAENEYRKAEPLSERIASSRMKKEIGTQIDKDLKKQVDEASDRFSKTILGPLVSLNLDPVVLDMETTESRLIARYRMAGPWQLAGMSPRPRAPSDSLLSFQVHQSALNNTLEQLVVQPEPQPLEQLMTECFDLLGVPDTNLPEDMPEGVIIQFAKHRPVTVEIEDGKVWITMRIIRLQKDRLKLRNFIVRAAYTPQYEGFHAYLMRDGHLSISGPRMSMRQRLPVRAIFNKVLSPSQKLPMTAAALLAKHMPADTGITQLELRDGWVGIAFGQVILEGGNIATVPLGQERSRR